MKKLLALVIIFLLLLLGVGGWWKLQLSPVSTDKQEKSIIISKGQGVSATADQLEKEGLIRSSLAFKIYVKQQNLGGKIQAGTFKLSPSMTTPQIVEALGHGALEVWVTLLEGWR